MAFEIPKLKYAEDALAPAISKETVSFHYGKHTKKYFDTMNELIKGTIYASRTDLDSLINKDSMLHMESKLFHNACQAWNHAFYWDGLCAKSDSGNPSDELSKAINDEFNTFEAFKKKLSEASSKQFGSGWGWLIYKEGKLLIKSTPNGTNPLTDKGQVPLLNIDVWEHAYYLDYMNERDNYIKAIWDIIDWTVVNERFAKAAK